MRFRVPYFLVGIPAVAQMRDTVAKAGGKHRNEDRYAGILQSSNSFPKLFIAGTEDRHTTLAGAERLFWAAAGPKELGPITGAGHLDLHRFAGKGYERRTLALLKSEERGE